jgi:hypothetical protein
MSEDLKALKERVAARDAKSQGLGLTDGLAPIYAVLDEIGKVGMERKEVATEEGLVNSGKLWSVAVQPREELELVLVQGEQTIKFTVQEDDMHISDYLVEMRTSHMAGWLWPRQVTDKLEKKRCFGAPVAIEWLVERLAPLVLTTAATEQSIA